MFEIQLIHLVNGGSAIVDADDYETLNQFRWFKSSMGYAYRQGWHPGPRTSENHWQIFLHREINKTPDSAFTDHINGNKLDNRKSNLRTVNKAQNSTNRPKIRKEILTSNLKGVSYHKLTGLWRARISDGGVDKTTYHKTEQQAALDYNRMAVERFGEYAHLNQLPDGIVPTVPRQKTSKYRGVGFHKKSRKWRASMDIGGVTKILGSYNTEIEAAIAYNEAAKLHRGESAQLNKIEH